MLSVQAPAPVSPQLWVLVNVKSILSCDADPLPGRFTNTLSVSSGEVSVTVRSPIQVWLRSRSTSIWSICSPEEIVIVSLIVELSAMASPGAELALTVIKLVFVLVTSQVSASRTALKASIRP